MTCGCGNSEVVQGSDGSLGFQLGIDGRAQPFDDATEVHARLISANLKTQTGPLFPIINTGSNDWRSGYGVVEYAAAESSLMEPGNYRLEITTTQPVVGVRIWRTSEIVRVVQTPSQD